MKNDVHIGTYIYHRLRLLGVHGLHGSPHRYVICSTWNVLLQYVLCRLRISGSYGIDVRFKWTRLCASVSHNVDEAFVLCTP
jgi:hypothetical protein